MRSRFIYNETVVVVRIERRGEVYTVAEGPKEGG